MTRRPLPSSHAQHLAERLLRDHGAASLAALDDRALRLLVHGLAGTPLQRGGVLHLSARRIKRTVRALRRQVPRVQAADGT